MTEIIIIDSKLKSSYSSSSSNFSLEFKQPIKSGRYKLREIYFPNAFYTVSSINNTIYFNDGIDKTAVLSTGFYSANELASEISAALNSASSNFSCSYSFLTNKFTITRSPGNFFLNFTFLNTSSAKDLIGANYNQSSTLVSSYTSDNLVNLNSYSYLLISLSNTNSLIRNNVESYGSFYLPITVPFLYLEIYSPKKCQNILFEKDIFRLEITVKDNNNNIVNLNGSEWFMTLEKY